MTTQTRLFAGSCWRRVLAGALAAALVLTAPGFEPYRLLAQEAAQVQVPISPAPSGAAGAAGAAGIAGPAAVQTAPLTPSLSLPSSALVAPVAPIAPVTSIAVQPAAAATAGAAVKSPVSLSREAGEGRGEGRGRLLEPGRGNGLLAFRSHPCREIRFSPRAHAFFRRRSGRLERRLFQALDHAAELGRPGIGGCGRRLPQGALRERAGARL
ncbi:MAG: hypothetical protein NTX64_13825, partial [Elusimicrobia bacterium]|nr:hypothetical protein [Elusimicrobiota bacterium]